LKRASPFFSSWNLKFHPVVFLQFNTDAHTMVICSQFPCENWTSQIDDPVSADAIVDRIIHVSYRVVMNADGKGKSMREVFGLEHSS
jgi:DNA replication protein DnaC